MQVGEFLSPHLCRSELKFKCLNVCVWLSPTAFLFFGHLGTGMTECPIKQDRVTGGRQSLRLGALRTGLALVTAGMCMQSWEGPEAKKSPWSGQPALGSQENLETG